MPETVDFCKNQAILGRGDAFAEQMLDIHGERLEIMTKHNVEFFVLSLASPGPQGRCNKEDAEVSRLLSRPPHDLGLINGLLRLSGISKQGE